MVGPTRRVNPAAPGGLGYKRPVTRFFLGFVLATALYSALAGGLYARGWLRLGAAPEPPILAASEPLDEDGPEDRKRGKRKRPTRVDRPRRVDEASPALPRGEATTGDDLDWNGERQVDMAGGEQQLTGKQIEDGFDGAMAKIRRCLVLVPAEGEVTGKLTFGMRVGGDGTPRAVNLSGPAVVTTGESGGCLRKAAEAIRFAKFAGPDMLFKYPITLQ
jgi:hypothetical protein